MPGNESGRISNPSCSSPPAVGVPLYPGPVLGRGIAQGLGKPEGPEIPEGEVHTQRRGRLCSHSTAVLHFQATQARWRGDTEAAGRAAVSCTSKEPAPGDPINQAQTQGTPKME